MSESKSGGKATRQLGSTKRDQEKQKDIRLSNLVAARSIADAIRTSLGPKGMDKMITDSSGDVTITNDGATILDKITVQHPAAKMLIELSKSQDIEAGDGTTSVCVLAGSLLEKAEELLEKGIHPVILSHAWKKACDYSLKILEKMSTKIDLSDRDMLIKIATTSLSSKVVSQYSDTLAPIAVDAVLKIIQKQQNTSTKTPLKNQTNKSNKTDGDDISGDHKVDLSSVSNVDLRQIRVVKKLGDKIEDTEIVPGLIFAQNASSYAGGPTKIQNAKIALIQFQISNPKTDMDNEIQVGSAEEINRIAREEKKYILSLIKPIIKSGCNVLIIQKSILRESLSLLGCHYLAKKNIMVVKDIERDDMPYIAKALNCKPVANPQQLTKDKLGYADEVAELSTAGGPIVKITGLSNPGAIVSVFIRGSNQLIIDEAERSLHDALCVVRSLVKQKYIISGGGAPEIQLSLQLNNFLNKLNQNDKDQTDNKVEDLDLSSWSGLQQYCLSAFAEALEVIPYTLAENAGLNPINIVTKLRNQHKKGNTNFGIDVTKAGISDMMKIDVIQPLLVNTSAISLATQFVTMLLKVDDIVQTR